MTVTLQAWQWGLLVYAAETHAEERDSLGHADVANVYRAVAAAACAELGVARSGDLPVKVRRPE